MGGPAEQELRRLVRRCAGVLHLVVAAIAGVLAVAVTPAVPVLAAVGVVAAWSVAYFLLLYRPWLLAADVAVISVACLTQRWTVPPDALDNSTSWLLAVTSIAVATWQWHDDVRVGALTTAVIALATVVGAGVTTESLSVTGWLALEAALSRGLYQLVRAGAREADRIMAVAERTRRTAAVATARRAAERDHLAAIHDTAAATFQAIGAGVVTGREPWLNRQLADALNEVTGSTPTTHGDTGHGSTGHGGAGNVATVGADAAVAGHAILAHAATDHAVVGQVVTGHEVASETNAGQAVTGGAVAGGAVGGDVVPGHGVTGGAVADGAVAGDVATRGMAPDHAAPDHAAPDHSAPDHSATGGAAADDVAADDAGSASGVGLRPPVSIVPSATDSFGGRGLVDLVPLLDDVVRRGPVAVELVAVGTAPLPAAVAVALCRAAREALCNVGRHAGVDRASVRLVRRGGGVLVEVSDDGVGFDPLRISPHRRGISLSLVERMRGVGGRARVTSHVGGGTRVRLEWPDG